MKRTCNLLNYKITNDKPLYHDTLGPVLGVHIQRVRFVDTNARISLITVEYERPEELEAALRVLEQYRVVHKVVSDDYEPVRSSSDGVLSHIPRVAEAVYGHSNHVWSEELDTLYHLALVPSFVTLSRSASDKTLLKELASNGMHSNHWDTWHTHGERHSLVVPVGDNLDLYPEIAKRHGVGSEPAWRNDKLWRNVAATLYAQSHVKRTLAFRRQSQSDFDDAFQDQLIETRAALARAAGDVLAAQAVDAKRLAGVLGNFDKYVGHRLSKQRRDARRMRPGLVDDCFDEGEQDALCDLLDAEHAKHLRRVVTQWVTRLDPKDQTLLRARIAGNKWADAALTAATTAGAARVRFSRMMKSLRSCIEQQGELSGKTTIRVTSEVFGEWASRNPRPEDKQGDES